MALKCKKCGLPDEIRDMGPKMIARWRKQNARVEGTTKREAKEAKKPTTQKRKHKHGRVVGKKTGGVEAPKYPNKSPYAEDTIPKVSGTDISMEV